MINRKLKNLKLIVSDIDGTLLKNDGSIGEETKRAIKELMNKDVIISLATGRMYSSAVNIANELSLNGPVISVDGASIREQRSSILYESFIKKQHVKKALKLAEQYLVKIVLCDSDAIYYTDENTVITSMLEKYGAAYKKVDKYDDLVSRTFEIVCASDMKDSIKTMAERLNFPFTFGCSASYFQSRSNRNIYYLEVRKNGINKGKGVKRLQKKLKIKPENTAVIGDWYNDISMFQTNSINVALANAVPELVRNADYITKGTNDEEGIVDFFKMVIRAKQN